MADDRRREMEEKAREDAKRIDTPTGAAGGVAVPGDETHQGRLVGDAKAAFEGMPQGQQGMQGQGMQGGQAGGRWEQGRTSNQPSMGAMTTPPQPMGAGKTGQEKKTGMGMGMGGLAQRFGMGRGGGDRTMTGTAQAENVTVRGVCAVAQAEEAYVTGASGAVITGGNATFTGGTAAVVSRGETKIQAGGAPLIISGDEIEIEKGGGAVLIAKEIEIEENGYAGIALAGKVEVKEGGKVLISTWPAILFGAAFGLTFALVRSLMGAGAKTETEYTTQEEEPGFFGKMAGGLTTGALLSRFATPESEEMYAQAARASARRHARVAMRDVKRAAKHASKATKQAATGRF